MLLRDDLHPVIESIVGDCCGPGSAYDSVRRHLSHYAVDHWESTPTVAGVGAIGRLMDVVFATQAPRRGGRCRSGVFVGRSTFSWPRAPMASSWESSQPVHAVRRPGAAHGRVSYPRRRVGMVFDRRTHPVQVADPERVDFWAADAMALPLVDGISTTCVLNSSTACPTPARTSSSARC